VVPWVRLVVVPVSIVPEIALKDANAKTFVTMIDEIPLAVDNTTKIEETDLEGAAAPDPPIDGRVAKSNKRKHRLMFLLNENYLWETFLPVLTNDSCSTFSMVL